MICQLYSFYDNCKGNFQKSHLCSGYVLDNLNWLRLALTSGGRCLLYHLRLQLLNDLTVLDESSRLTAVERRHLYDLDKVERGKETISEHSALGS